jgi:putative acetyltransferase
VAVIEVAVGGLDEGGHPSANLDGHGPGRGTTAQPMDQSPGPFGPIPGLEAAELPKAEAEGVSATDMVVVIAEEHPDTPDAVALIEELDAHLADFYPSESRHGFSVEKLLRDGVVFFVTRADGQPAGCGGVLLVGDDYAEIKRMYVRPAFRGRGLGQRMLDHLVARARAHGLSVVRLETGIHQREAIALYERSGFRRIPPFGPYWDDPVSRCYEKVLAPASPGPA